MGKRSDKERKARDYYPTPYEACVPLLTWLWSRQDSKPIKFIEPCAGDGRLIAHFERHGHKCVDAFDIEPQAPHPGVKIPIKQRDVVFMGGVKYRPCDYIITNPPWTCNRDGTGVLHDMIRNFSEQRPTWLLFHADWMHTAQAREFKDYCHVILSVGRVSWMENGTQGMDNCAWYLFDRSKKTYKTEFIWPQ